MPFGDIYENRIGFQRYIICEGTEKKCGDRYDLFNDEKEIAGEIVVRLFYKGTVPR